MDQLSMYLACKHIPRIHMKSWVLWYNPKAEEAERRDSWGLLISHQSLFSEFHNNEKPSKTKP